MSDINFGGSGWELFLILIVFFMIIAPILLFIIGLVIYSKNREKGKKILIAAVVYTLISAGVCGSAMI